MDANTLYYLLAAVLVVVGLVGTVLPVIPGTILVFAGLLLAAWADGFARVGVVGLTIIATLGLLAAGADFIGSLHGAKRVGASPQALVGAAIGGLVGFFFGIPGMIVGPFFGAVAGEFLARGRLRQAGKVGLGTWLGLIAAAVLKVVIAFMMIATFVTFYVMNG
ncbi:MAG TPA: DUF456 domain-containing protein [Usitatibacter sp.]|nr:DUF456 domain-containing protein [Usitatibacter sp.]